MSSDVITVVLVDDQPVVRRGLRVMIEGEPDIEVVGEVADGVDAVRVIRELRPDVALMDVRMPRLDGIAATEKVRALGLPTKVVVLTTYGSDEQVYAALRAGACGFLLKTDDPQRLIDGVRAAAAGDSLLGPETTRRLIELFLDSRIRSNVEPQELGRLTPREREVFLHLAHGESNSEIARTLYLGEGTVKTHVARVFAKLGVRDRVQAVIYAYDHDLVRSGPGDGP